MTNVETNATVDCWSGFDRIYCISLENRSDRREAAQAQFQGVGLGGRVEFLIVPRHPTNSEQGIFESHLACLRAGLAAGAKTIAVFEDDIVFRRFSPRRLQAAASFLAAQPDWRLFFFGCFVHSSRKTGCPAVRKVKYRCTAHGYAVHAAMAQELSDMRFSGIPYDTMLKNLGDRGVYALYPAIAYQSGASTDNYNLLRLDQVRRRIGGLERLQRWNEFSHRHRAALILGHVIVAVMLVLLILHHYAAAGGR